MLCIEICELVFHIAPSFGEVPSTCSFLLEVFSSTTMRLLRDARFVLLTVPKSKEQASIVVNNDESHANVTSWCSVDVRVGRRRAYLMLLTGLSMLEYDQQHVYHW